jgi:hypothetical protein
MIDPAIIAQIKLEERKRCERIIESYMRYYKDDGVRKTLLRNVLAKLREKEKANDK